MKLKIKKLLREGLLKEYISNQMIYLKDYFSMPESSKKAYLPHEYNYFFEDFLIEEDIDFEQPKEIKQSNYADEPEEYVDMFDSSVELIIWLENNNKELYDKFSDYLYNKIMNNELPIPEEEYPAWAYFDDNPILIKNQWLIHFTNNADSIAYEGFKYGAEDISKLGLTTRLSEFDKKYGGYNFSYLLSDFKKYGIRNRGGYKYGDEAVIFRASGIKLYHYGDEEPQVIFYGNTAKDIIAITKGDNSDYSIKSKDDKILFENDDLETVVNWLIKNYNQYRKKLI